MCLMARQCLLIVVRPIGIGRGLTASPLPHHRTYGSRIRRFGRFRQGQRHPNRSVVSRRASRAFIPEAEPRSPPRRMPSRRSTTGHDSLPPFRPSAHDRMPTMPSADFCGAVREDSSALSPVPGHPADLPWSPVRPSVHRRPIDQAQAVVEGGRRGRVPARPDGTTPPIGFVSLAPHVRSTRPSDLTSR